VGGFTLGSASTVQVDAGSFTVKDGAINGNQNLTKTGAGSLNINGNNNQILDFAVNAGTVNVNGNDGLFNRVTVTNSAINFGVNTTNTVVDRVSILNGGTLRLNNGTVLDVINTNTTISSGGTLSVNGASTIGGNLVMDNGSLFDIGAGDLLDVNGTLSFSNSFTFNFSDSPQFEVDALDFGAANTVTWNFDTAALYGSWLIRSQNDIFTPYIGSKLLASNLSLPYSLESYYNGSYYFLTVIPEPSTYVMMVIGAVFLVLAGLRKRKSINQA